MARRRQIYEGKAKLYEGPEPGTIIQYFKDDATAFNAEKKGTINGKGVINNRISEYRSSRLSYIGIPTHFIRRLNMREQLVRQVEIIPLEVEVRNVAAGSLSKTPRDRGRRAAAAHADRILPQGRRALGDPWPPEEEIACFNWCSHEELQDMSSMAIRINDFLCGMFSAIDIRLIDFKLEFGRIWDGDYSRVILADERPAMVAACGISTPARSSTRTASAATWAAKAKPIRKSRAVSACCKTTTTAPAKCST